jgi:hypothetical protein
MKAREGPFGGISAGAALPLLEAVVFVALQREQAAADPQEKDQDGDARGESHDLPLQYRIKFALRAPASSPASRPSFKTPTTV